MRRVVTALCRWAERQENNEAVTEAAGRIVAHELTKRFGLVTAVDGLSFEVRPGVVTGFLGPNGSGKTTTLRLLLGLVRPDRRERPDRRSVVRRAAPPGHRARRGVGGARLPPGPHRPPAPAGVYRRDRGAGRRRRAGAADRRAGRGGRPPGGPLLAGHAAAAGRRGGAARRPAGAGAGRAGQRAGPGGHRLAARLPARVRPRRAAPCWSPATCWPRWSRPRTAWS